MPAMRNTAGAEAAPRFAILGAAERTGLEASVTVQTSNPAVEDKFAGVIGRWVDDDNYLIAELHLAGASDTLRLALVVGGVRTELGSSPIVVLADVGHRITLTAFEDGRAYARVTRDGAVITETSGSSDELDVGGALESGKVGFSDQSTGAGAGTRTYSDFTASVPPTPAVALHAGRQMNIVDNPQNVPLRENADGSAWGTVPEYRGREFAPPPATDAGRQVRVIVTAHRGDVDVESDDASPDQLQVSAIVTPRVVAFPRRVT